MYIVVPFVLFCGQVLPGNEFNFSEVRAGVHVFHKYHYLFVVSVRYPDCYACRCTASEFVCVLCNVVVSCVWPWCAEGRFIVQLLLVLDSALCCVYVCDELKDGTVGVPHEILLQFYDVMGFNVFHNEFNSDIDDDKLCSPFCPE